MNKSSILKMFFNEVLPSISKGSVMVDDFIYNVHFNTVMYHDGKSYRVENINDEDVPTLFIKNVETFSDLLYEFISEVINDDMKWCSRHLVSAPIETKIKYFLSLMWTNMTATDFSNAENYIRRCISFIKDHTFEELSLVGEPMKTLMGSRIMVSNVEDKSCHSTPYMFKMFIENDEGYRFPLPDVNYAIEEINGEKKAYIYALQNDSKFKIESSLHEKYCKKINYLLYKTDRDITPEELEKKNLSQDTSTWDDENIVVVSRSALVSLTVALSIFDKMGIKEVLAPTYLPLHWNAKKSTHEKKVNHYKSQGHSDEEVESYKNELDDEQVRIQRNLTEKFIRNFRRLDYHFDGLEITAYPWTGDDFMHIALDELQPKNEEHLLAEISNSVNVSVNRNRLK